MKLKKRVKDFLDNLYNAHQDSAVTSDFNLVNGLGELAATYPEHFSFEHCSNISKGTKFRREYLFKFNNLGYYPDFLKSIGA